MAKITQIPSGSNQPIYKTKDFRGAFKGARGLSTQQLRKRTTKLTASTNDAMFDPQAHAKLVALRRALKKRIVGEGFNDMSRADRNAAVRKKLGDRYGDLFYTKPKVGNVPNQFRR